MKDRKSEKQTRKKTSRNLEFTVVTYFFFILFLALMAYFIYFQVVKSEDFINSPYNSLQDLFSKNVIRGNIVSSDGYILARTNIDSNQNETREYPYGRTFAHAVGYSVNGKAGLERQANFNLLRSHQFFLEQILNDLKGEKSYGDNVITTLDYNLQNVAYKALGKHDGAVIAFEPSTGKILTMVSKPDYDPNNIAANWEKVNSEGSTVLYNRATQGQYAPGSVFKIFTLLEYYKENDGLVDNYSFDCNSSFTYDGTTIHCAGNKTHGTESLKDSFANSCNSSFAQIGLDVDNDKLNDLCDSLLFNTKLPVSFEYSKSKFSLSKSDSSSMTMETCIGQGKTMVSPLHMAMMAGAICNDGVLMTPYLIDHTENHKGITVKTTSPKEYGQVISKKESQFLEEYMNAVVTSGTGSKLNGQSYSAYGKTGTAQVSDSSDQTNAWFVGYARKNGKEIAIAVIVENSGAGSTYAVPIAKSVFDTYFN